MRLEYFQNIDKIVELDLRNRTVRAEALVAPYELREWRIRGPFRSRAAVREVADELRRGVHAEPEHALPA